MKLSVVIPCFNEEESLPATLERVLGVVKPVCKDFEILLVDDGSRDATWVCISRASAADERVRGIRLARNFGHQIALSAGLHAAQGDRIFIIDADLQDPPELLPKMMGALLTSPMFSSYSSLPTCTRGMYSVLPLTTRGELLFTVGGVVYTDALCRVNWMGF